MFLFPFHVFKKSYRAFVIIRLYRLFLNSQYHIGLKRENQEYFPYNRKIVSPSTSRK